MSPINSALLYLISTVFDLYLFIVIIRIILAWSNANYFNPLTQFVIKCTDFLVKPLRRILPNYKNIETASVVLLIVLEIFKFFLLITLTYGIPNIVGVLILSIGDMLKLILLTFFYAILIQAILSWIQPYSPMNQILNQFTSPIMRPLSRVIPPVGGFDITPIPAMIILQLLVILIAAPLINMGYSMAMNLPI